MLYFNSTNGYKYSIFIPKSTNSVRNKGYIDTVFKILLHLKKFFSPIS